MKLKSEFSRNVFTLVMGTSLAQAIPIIITPILTRLYTPEDFGLLALFMSITMTFGAVANGRYELAIMLPHKDEDAINIAALCVFIATVFSFVLLMISLLFNIQFANLIGDQKIGMWLYFVPFVVWMISLYNVLNYLNTRKKIYKDIARSKIYKSTAMAVVQLSIGFIKAGASGLILGQIVSQVVANYRLAINAIHNFELNSIDKLSIKCVAKRYVDFPKFSMWANLLNNLSTHLINILISIYYSVAILGFYSLVQKILGMPSFLVGSSIGQVYFEQASKERQRTGLAVQSFNLALKKLFYLSVPAFSVLYFFVEDVFLFVFGESWSAAGGYAKILTLFFAIKFINSAMSVTVAVFEKNKLSLIINIIILVLSLLLFYLMSSSSFDEFLYVFNIVMSGCYAVFLIIYYRLAHYGELL